MRLVYTLCNHIIALSNKPFITIQNVLVYVALGIIVALHQVVLIR